MPPTRLLPRGVGDALALGVQSRQGPVEGSKPPDLPMSACREGPNTSARAVWGGPKAYSIEGLHQVLSHPHVLEGSTVVLPQPAGREKRRDHPQAVAMVATEALGWYGRKGAMGPPQHPRSRRPRTDSAAAPRAMRLGEGSPLSPEGRDGNLFRGAG